ncbi:hypothetical protein [Streptomyces cucumeris]|uniref:hypothetical protein n=1 Tax=Streptomyces cucumeris TaxID=2962890 RepID=UPI003D708A62
MSTRPRSAAATRRKILFVVAAGALAMGAAPASAAGGSPSPSGTLEKHPDRIAVVCDAVERHDGADARAKRSVPGKGKTEGETPSQILCGKVLPGKPGEPGKPGNQCVVVVMKHEAGQKKATPALPGRHGERVKRGERVRPTGPIKIGKLDRTVRPGDVCGVFLMREATVAGR